MAWCWICHLKTSRGTLHTIYFPNCRRTLRSYFFARKLMKFINEKSCVIMENWNQTLWKTFKDNSQPKKFRKTETKLCGNLQRQFSDFWNIKTILSRKTLRDIWTLWKTFKDNFRILAIQRQFSAEKLCVIFETEPNFVDKRCVEFFSSWKYNTVCNIGLFQVARLVITQNDVV